jgi:hypothetical protein
VELKTALGIFDLADDSFDPFEECIIGSSVGVPG